MSIFTRFQDIINSNVNAILDRTENPEKMIRLMIEEMEGTLVELKRSCAGAMADVAIVKRHSDKARREIAAWENKAAMAVSKGRDDLAREALLEKRSVSLKAERLDRQWEALETVVSGYQSDMSQLEEKLREAKERRRALVQRYIHARRKKATEERIRSFDSAETVLRFERLAHRLERMASEADLVNYGRKSPVDGKFEHLMAEVEKQTIEAELARLKRPRYETNM